MSQICPRNVPDMFKRWLIYVLDMSQICLLPRERLDDLSTYKGQSNISVSPALQPTKQPANQPPGYRASPDFSIFL